MNALWNGIGILALCGQLAACSGWRPATLPPTDPTLPPESGQDRDTVALGDDLRLALADGALLDGRVCGIDSASISLECEPDGFAEVKAARPDTVRIGRDWIVRVQRRADAANPVLVLGAVGLLFAGSVYVLSMKWFELDWESGGSR